MKEGIPILTLSELHDKLERWASNAPNRIKRSDRMIYAWSYLTQYKALIESQLREEMLVRPEGPSEFEQDKEKKKRMWDAVADWLPVFVGEWVKGGTKESPGLYITRIGPTGDADYYVDCNAKEETIASHVGLGLQFNPAYLEQKFGEEFIQILRS